MFNDRKSAVIEAALSMKEYGLIALSGGNVSERMPTGEILVTPSGMGYEGMVEDDILVMDIDANIIEGERKPSVDSQALLYIYKHMPEVNSVIHTHQPYATAVGLIADEFPAILTTLVNATKGPVKVAPYSSAASIEMGIETVEHIGDQLAVILKHHGVITIGSSLKEALYACVYLEEAAKCYLAARAVTPNLPMLSKEQVQTAVEVFKSYGQKKNT